MDSMAVSDSESGCSRPDSIELAVHYITLWPFVLCAYLLASDHHPPPKISPLVDNSVRCC